MFLKEPSLYPIILCMVTYINLSKTKQQQQDIS